MVAGSLTSERRVQIYRDGYRARLIECLADDYPTVQRTLGAAGFEALALRYIHCTPPRSHSLNFYGARFPRFCRALEGELHASLAELARLEWGLVEVIHAPDQPVLSPTELAAVAPEAWNSLRLVASPALKLFQCDYRVNAYLQGIRDGKAPELPKTRDPHRVVVCRGGRHVWRLELGPELGALLEQLLLGHTLGAALQLFRAEQAGRAETISSAAVQAAFGQWMQVGCFSGFELTTPPGSS